MRITRPSIYLYIIAFVAVISACKKVDINYGSQYIDNELTQIVMCDTITPQLTTVYIDSFVTSGMGTALLGSYTDPAMGKIKVQPYIELGIPDANSTPSISASFDSLIVVLKYNKTYYGDTTSVVKLSVHEVTEEILPYTTLNASNTSFYNTQSFAISPTPLGQGSFVIRPTYTDTLAIRLNDNLGINLLRMLKTKSDTLTDLTKFISYFKGVSVVSDAANNLAFGCKDSLTMRLYYREPGAVENQKYTEFKISGKGHNFYNVQNNRTGTPLGGVGFGPSNKVVTSTSTGNAVYSQFISGSIGKIRFPSLRQLLQAPNFSRVIQANLYIKPVKNSYKYPFSLPQQLRLVQTTDNTSFGADITNTSGGTQTGSLYIDYSDASNTEYTYDVTSYLQSQLGIGTDNENGLFVLTPSSGVNKFNTTFDRVVIGDSRAEYPIQLVIIYLALP